jgi:hypothetical protein
MKLRAIELTNVRRFAGRTVRVAGIGDGVSVLAAPNEAGKSTLFDALQALLFQKYSSKSKELRALQPHQGDAPRAAAEIEVASGRFRIEKRWLSQAEARVLDGAGHPVALADQAEAWIEAHVAGPLGGPAGLLWVRQGQAEFDPRDNPAARRDILSAVAGEVDALTGGRRMDAVMARVTEALEGLALKSGKPRSGGAWEAAQAEAEALAAQEAELARKVAVLAEALAERREVERQRAALDDPQAAADRARLMAQAQAAKAALEQHEVRRRALTDRRSLAETRLQAATREREVLRARTDEAERAAAAAAQAEAALAVARTTADAGRSRVEVLRGAADGARAAADALRARAEAAQRGAEARRAAQQRDALAERLREAEAAERAAAAAEAARAAIPVTPARLEALRQAEVALARLVAQAEARAVLIRFDYDSPARALQDGTPVEGPLRLRAPAVFDLPGIGRLTVEPGAAGSDDPAPALAAARLARRRALEDCGAADAAAAAAALAAAEDLAREAAEARARLRVLAPDGLAPLRAELARAGMQAANAPEGDADAPDPEAVRQAEAAARQAEAEARAAEEGAAQAAATLSGISATAEAARTRLTTAEAARGQTEAHAAALAATEAARETALADRAALDRALDELTTEAPDAETVAAQIARAQSVAQAHEDGVRRLGQRLAELRGQIGAMADEGIEETLEEVRGRLQAARERAGAQGAEVAALLRLRRALEAARGAARSAYLAPVVQELTPLLGLLYGEASLEIDDATLLPRGLERGQAGGRPEALEILSGGTREQVAVLTRLAFARLLARRGQEVPVILDDALVQTDDARIEAMFTALHRAAQGQQVIVLTCRERAFAALGGQRLVFEGQAGA